MSLFIVELLNEIHKCQIKAYFIAKCGQNLVNVLSRVKPMKKAITKQEPISKISCIQLTQ